jgi:predicted transposase/invertase (TIGR01784 family)
MIAKGSGPRRTTLDPKLDIVFWMLFGAEQNRALLLSLLNAVLKPAGPILAAEVRHSQPERSGVDDKSIALDLRVRLSSGEQIDVEMQTQPRPALRERALYYWSRLYAGQLLRGALYEELRKCVVVLITDFAELATLRFHSIFTVNSLAEACVLTDHLELHLVELPKLERALDRNDEPALAAWAKFLSAGSDEELKVLAMEDPIFKQAKDALDSLSADPEARIRAEMREMALATYELDRTWARREGRAEGKAEGRAELIGRQLTAKFGQLSAETLQRLSQATEAEHLEWSERLLFATSLHGVFNATPQR